MSPPEDTPLLARLARWSEWWFTPRWRALLTWLALTAIAAAVLHENWDRFEEMTQQPISFLNGRLQTPLPPIFNSAAHRLTVWLLLIWFQPLTLRLSLRRGLIWIGLPLVAEILWEFLGPSSRYDIDWTGYALQCGAAAMQCWVLWGWRSRPWMCLLAQAATSALSIIDPLRNLDPPLWLAFAVSELPYAALLLYGTRLLRPEERARGTTGK